jgi:GTP-binding protein Era
MTTRCGYIALIGAPNAGKSTLMNRLTGQKLSIVTPKAQTTRNRILGIMVAGESQLIFVDTPGIFEAKQRFEKAMVRSALGGARDADVILLLIDAAKGSTPEVRRILEELPGFPGEKILALNKTDLVSKEALLPLTQELFGSGEFSRCFMISAQKGDGTDDVIAYLAGRVPEGVFLFPEDEMTDMPLRFLAAEITREKLFLRLQKELPYQVAVETEEWKEHTKGKTKGDITIRQVVYVRSEGQKTIVIGKGGAMLKSIGEAARKSMEHFLHRRVHLFLFVKVAENWKENREFYEAIGLEF